MLDINSLKKLAEGKTKVIYENPGDQKTVYMYFKDDITAGDGAKHDLLEGKALIDWKINRDAFELLEKTGFHCPSEQALKIYAENGAQVDFESQIVKLSSDVILEAMSHAPRYYTMGGRTLDFDLDLSQPVTYEATDGTGTKTVDFATRELRSSIKADVATSARLADYLPSISFYWPMVSAQDHPISPSLHELEASFNNTLKHVQTPTVVETVTARYSIEMAKVITGNEAEMRLRPPLSLLICTIAPLAQDGESMEAALVAA